MSNFDELTSIEKAVNSRVKLDAKSRENIYTGEYDINLVQKITGSLIVEPDTKRTRTSNLLGKRVLALCLHYMGVQEDNVGPLLDLILEEAVNGNKDFLNKIEKDPRIVAAMGRLNERLAKAPKMPVKGKIKADLKFSTVDLQEIKWRQS